MKKLFLTAALTALAATAFGGCEAVEIIREVDCGVVIEWRNGERWLLELGAGRVPREGSSVTANFRGKSPDMGGTLVTGFRNIKIWGAKALD
jgi:hypothetical protein